jgi:PAS domain S-box-containing protein
MKERPKDLPDPSPFQTRQADDPRTRTSQSAQLSLPVGSTDKPQGKLESLLVQIVASMAALDSEEVLREILNELRRLAPILNAAVHLLDEEGGRLKHLESTGSAAAEPLCQVSLDDPGIVARCARLGRPVFETEATCKPDNPEADPRTCAQYAVPLKAAGRLLGVLHIESDRAEGLPDFVREFADQLAAPTALALERSQLHKRLRDSEERFRCLFEQELFGAVLCDLHGKILLANPEFTRIVWFAPDELHGVDFVEFVYPDDRPMLREAVRGILSGEMERCALEIRHCRRTGDPAWCRASFSILRDSAGEPFQILAIIHDVGEWKRTQEDRDKLQEQLLHAQKMDAIGKVASGVAHDFNNLLGVMMGYASLMRVRLPPDDPLQDAVAMVEQSAERAAELTRHLLGLSRHDKGPQRPVDLRPVLDRVVKMARRTFDPRVRIVLTVEGDVPAVLGDAGRIEQAVLNLFLNARDAMPEGGTLTVEVRRSELGSNDTDFPEQLPAGQYVELCVRDTGGGIEPALLARIFEPFFTTKEGEKGTGLGLSMVRAIVENHGGSIKVRSEPGRGTEFTVLLPATKEGAAPEVNQGSSGSLEG